MQLCKQLAVAPGACAVMHVDVRRCAHLTNQGATSLARLPSLVDLDLSDCNNLGDIGLQTLLRGLPLLQNLSLQHCAHITDAGAPLSWFLCYQACVVCMTLQPSIAATSSTASMMSSLVLSGQSVVSCHDANAMQTSQSLSASNILLQVCPLGYLPDTCKCVNLWSV